MGKLQNLSFVVSIRRYFTKHVKSGNMNPDFAWMVILTGSVIMLSIVGVVAYLLLDWAQFVDGAAVTAQKSRDTLSSEDLHSVVEIYEVKENTYRDLHERPPVAPYLKAGTKIQNAEVENVGTTSE